MNLVIHQMVQFEHVHRAHGDLLVKRFTGPAVIQGGLRRTGQTRFFQQVFDFQLFGAIEYRSGHV